MTKVKSDGHIWGLEFNRYVYFLFRGNRTILGSDIAKSISDLENSRSRSWPMSNPLHAFKTEGSIDTFVFCFVSIGPFLAEILPIPYLTLKIQGHVHDANWPKSNRAIYRPGPSILPKMNEIHCSDLSRERNSAASGARGGLRTGTKAWSHPRYTGVT